MATARGGARARARVKARVYATVRVRVRVRVMFRVRVRVRVRVRGGLLPTTSNSICYSRVDKLAIFSHCQSLDREDT